MLIIESMNAEEQLLIHEIRGGNKQVFRAIYEQYYAPLVRFAGGYLHTQDLSEDVVQNFFIQLWESRENLQVTGSIKSYCFTAVRNRCLNRLRDYHLRDEKNLIYLNTILQLNIELTDQDGDLALEVRRALEQLPEQMKKIFVKRYFEGLKTQEIADQLDISPNTINTQLKRGKQKLRDFLKDLGMFFLSL